LNDLQEKLSYNLQFSIPIFEGGFKAIEGMYIVTSNFFMRKWFLLLMKFSSIKMRQDRGMTGRYRMLVLKINRTNHFWNVRGKEVLPYSLWEKIFLKSNYHLEGR
jgi:hypothetical protein